MRHLLATTCLTFLIPYCQPALAQISEFSIPVHRKNHETRQALEQMISIDFNEIAMQKVVIELQLKLGLQILLHESAMDNGLDEELPVTARLIDLRGSSILDILLEPFECTYRVQDGVVMVCSDDEACDRPAREVFALFDSRIKEERLEALVVELVDPESWEINGGNGTLASYDGRLIVVQSEKNICDVRDLLISIELLMADIVD